MSAAIDSRIVRAFETLAARLDSRRQDVTALCIREALGDLEASAVAPEPAADGWYCAHCQTGVRPVDVTFEETHATCGRIITNDRAPEPAPAATDAEPVATLFVTDISINTEYVSPTLPVGKHQMFSAAQLAAAEARGRTAGIATATEARLTDARSAGAMILRAGKRIAALREELESAAIGLENGARSLRSCNAGDHAYDLTRRMESARAALAADYAAAKEAGE